MEGYPAPSVASPDLKCACKAWHVGILSFENMFWIFIKKIDPGKTVPDRAMRPCTPG